jgi:hypothetical protein
VFGVANETSLSSLSLFKEYKKKKRKPKIVKKKSESNLCELSLFNNFGCDIFVKNDFITIINIRT